MTKSISDVILVKIQKMKQALLLFIIFLKASCTFSQLNNNQSALLMARPNPTTGDAELYTDSTFLNKRAIVFNHAGQQVDAFVITSLSQRIKSSFYQRGTYYIRFDNYKTLRLIKE